ncbi:Congested-like trachea protein [Folsomia candida]|uniref:Congested-like trachea protein n=1 Tax=Folsomia candida TaxID=158441 RepID=A0A226F3M3_FOLCA|nr:Congested-like trachea protein [Folsomia candida]
MSTDSNKLACSAIAVTTGIIVGYPFDTLKTRLQILGRKSLTAKASHKPYYPALYSSSLDCLIKTVRHEGAQGLFKGVTITLLGQAPTFCLGFIGIDIGKIIAERMLPSTEGAFSFSNWSVATSISGGLTTLLMAPAERIKSILQIQAVGTTHRHYNNGTVLSNYGVRVEFVTCIKGLESRMCEELRKLAYICIGTCDTITAMMTPSSGKMSQTRAIITRCLCGMLVMAAILPIDTVKTIIQTAPDGTTKSTKQVVTHTLTTDGIPGFYKGLVPILKRAIIFNIVTSSSLTWMHTILEERRVKNI